jgi:hypothetical protein
MTPFPVTEAVKSNPEFFADIAASTVEMLAVATKFSVTANLAAVRISVTRRRAESGDFSCPGWYAPSPHGVLLAVR